MAPKKGRLDSIKSAVAGAVAGAAARIPFLPKRQASAPEPFSAIEDDTPLGDLLSSPNAAPSAAPASTRERPDFRAVATSAVEAAVKNTPILIGIIVVVVFLLMLAVTALIVNSPPKAPAAAAPFTEIGQSLVKTWLPPPGDPLEPRMAMERDGPPAYSAEDAARLGIASEPSTLAALRDKNSAAIEDLYGTVP